MKPLSTGVLVMLICIGFGGGGCATLLRGDKQKMKFQTNALDSTVEVDGKSYPAPAVVKLKRNKPHTVYVHAPGYQSIRFDLKSQWDGASLGNIIMPGGSVGFATDTFTGADRRFYTLATIELEKCQIPATSPVQMYEYRGRVLPKDAYDGEVREMKKYHSRPVWGDS